MLLNRDAFLNKGYYDGIPTVLVDVLRKNIIPNPDDIVVDIGCGTGNYISSVVEQLHQKSKYYGIDISKEAIKIASKNSEEVNWVVASSKKIPFKGNSISVIISSFAPIYMDEISRVLKNDGLLISVVPGKEHLIELRELIYSKIYDKPDKNQKDYDNTELIDTRYLKYKKRIEGNDLIKLLKMTPHYWKTKKDSIDVLRGLDYLDVSIDVQIIVYKKSLQGGY